MNDKALNGAADRASITGWIIALLPGRTVIGSPRGTGGVSAPTILSPVFDFQGGIVAQHDPRGNQVGVGVQLLVMPLLGLTIDSMELPKGTPCIAVDLLHERERSAIGAQVTQAKALLTGLRAALSGIVVPPPDLKLPPLAKAVR
jgi:hypothetical protein